MDFVQKRVIKRNKGKTICFAWKIVCLYNKSQSMDFENQLELGKGIYTASDISKILRVPNYKVNRWISKYWDGKLGEKFSNSYSWKVENTRAVSFHTLIEFYVLILLSDAGVKTRNVLEAHIELSNIYRTPFPFANKNILEGIKTDGKKIYFQTEEGFISLDGTKQFQIDFIKMFFRNLEFDNELLVSRLFPLGKNKNVIVDPDRQFGHPVIVNTNIYPEAIYNLYEAGEPIDFISYIYEIDEKDVKDAIEYCKAA